MRNRIKELRVMKASEILAHPENWRQHPPKQKKALRAVLNEIGYANAVIAYESAEGLRLIDGHLRRDVAGDEEIPVLVTDLSEDEARAALATLDPLAMMADSQMDLLTALAKDLKEFESVNEVLMALVGEVIGPLYEGDPPEAQIDRAEELNERWQVQRGDVWVIPSAHGGEHRLLCGDSTSADDVRLLMADGIKPRLMVTDPPYGVEYNQDWRSRNRTGKVTNDDNASWFDAWNHSPAAVAYVWHASKHATRVATDLELAGFEHRAMIIWNKPRHVFSQGHYHWKHEPCFYVVRKGQTAEWIGDRKQNTVWDIGSDDDAPGNHGTQKPVECMARPIRNHAGDVYDPFGGSGTTMVACEQLGRQCRMIEIEPKYCAVILERMSAMGLNPRRDG